MMNVVNNKLVIEEKGIYSIEKFLTARRLMYWQVYLHKTGLVSEQIIIKILKRAKILSIENDNFTSGSVVLDFFLKQRIDITNFTNDILEKFSLLDDTDLLIALKTWSCHSDFVLKNLSERILNRKLLKIKFVNESEIELQLKLTRKKWNKFSKVDISLMEYFVFCGKVSNIGYDELNNPIEILNKKTEVYQPLINLILLPILKLYQKEQLDTISVFLKNFYNFFIFLYSYEIYSQPNSRTPQWRYPRGQRS